MKTANINSLQKSQPVNDGIEACVANAITEVSKVVLGKQEQIKLALCCMFSSGHLLLEDKPGMGKTTLSQALASVFGLKYSRIQFTSDLLPADILGVSVYDQNKTTFSFHQGPIFNNLILADEINRTTPKTQSALLEAMEEGQVSIDGQTRRLPQPFFVIATQNPVSFSGTYPLPESQLDRFLMRIQLGYPNPEAERQLLSNSNQRKYLDNIQQCLDANDIQHIGELSAQVHATDSVMDYVQRLIAYSRQTDKFLFGLSPRGAMALVSCARTWALMHDRNHVLPEDVQAVLPAVTDHRLRGLNEGLGKSESSYSSMLLNEVDII